MIGGKMILNQLNATTINDLWYRAITLLLNQSVERDLTYVIEEGSYAGQKRLEYDFLTFQIEYPEIRPFIIMPENLSIPAPFDEAYLEEYSQYILTTYKPENTTYTYGRRLFNQIIDWNINAVFSNKNQIEVIIEKFKKAKNTNQCCASISTPSDIFLEDPPCCRVVDFNLKEGTLNIFLYFRSWDLWGGLPLNLAGFQLLKEYMADEIGVFPGKTIGCSKGLHLYDHCWEVAKMLTRKDKDFKIIGE